MQFVESQHTPRNTMLRAVRTGGPVTGGNVRKEYDELVAAWGLTPRLAVLLAGPPRGPTAVRGPRGGRRCSSTFPSTCCC